MTHTRGTRRIVGIIGALALAGCGQQAPAPAPVPSPIDGPIDVRVTELAPEVMDQLADEVAERIAAAAPERVPAVRERPARAVVPPVLRPRESPVAIEEPIEREAPRPRTPPPAPPPRTDPLDAASVARAEQAVDRALDWLARHQEPTGEWHPASGRDALAGEGATSARIYAPGVTGLAVRCYLADGQTHVSGEHRKVIRRALQYLRTIQDSEGCFGPRTSAHFQYNHASAALAMVEAWGATQSELFSRSAQRGVDFAQMSRNPYLGWRYGVRDGDNDTSVTGWMVQVLRAADTAGLEVDRGAFSGARAWVDKMTEPEFGRVGYQRRGGPPARTMEQLERFPHDLSESLTAVGLNIRIDTGQNPETNELIQKGARLLVNKPPRHADPGSVDFYYWYWGTMAMAEIGGDHWHVWSRALVATLLDTQDQDGSWDPAGPWAHEGGRSYSTAMASLALLELLHAERAR